MHRVPTIKSIQKDRAKIGGSDSLTELDKRKHAFVKEYREYISAEYMKQLNLDSIDDELKMILLKQFIIHFSSKNRISVNAQKLKYDYTFCQSDVITACFRMSYKSLSCSYANMFVSCNGSLHRQFFSTGPVYDSQDGEYRGRFLPMDYLPVLEKKYEYAFAEVEAMIVQKLSLGTLAHKVDFYYDPETPIEYVKMMRRFVDEKRLTIKFHIMAWLYDFHNLHINVAPIHMNRAYEGIIYQKSEIPLFEKILNKMTQLYYNTMMWNFQTRSANIDASLTLSEVGCGQKIMPLGRLEITKIHDSRFSVWRELDLNIRISALVLNFISPSFPIINNWFFVQNANATLFDNMAMHKKYEHSATADQYAQQMFMANKLGFVDKKKKQGVRSRKFKNLDVSTNALLEYMAAEIRLSTLAICMTNEFVHHTLRNFPAIVIAKQNKFGADKIFFNKDVFAKHMFEYIYGFYMMNKHTKMIHGDTHLNNVNIFTLYHMFNEEGKEYVHNPHIVYIMPPSDVIISDDTSDNDDNEPTLNDQWDANKSDTYMFPHFGTFSMIIDFSKSVTNDRKDLEARHGILYTNNYFTEQIDRIIAICEQFLPKFIETHKDAFVTQIRTNFAATFKALSAIDAFIFFKALNILFNVDPTFVGKIELAPGIKELARELEAASEKILFAGLTALINNSDQPTNWPNWQLIHDHFSEYIITPEKYKAKNAIDPISITDIYNGNNTLKYTMDNYDNYGPILSLDMDLELRKKHNLPDEADILEWLEYKKIDESQQLEELAREYDFDTWELEDAKIV